MKILSDQDRDDERVDSNDTGHDDRNQTLESLISNILFLKGRPLSEVSLTFMIRSGLNVATPAMPIPDFAVP